MPNKMLIDASHPEETRVVVVRGNRIEEFDFESQDKKQLRGNIYLARVTRVEPSLQAAFIEYGGNRHGFLAFNEIHPDYYQIPVADRQALLRAEEEAAARADEEEEAADQEKTERGKGRRRRRGAKAPAQTAEAGTARSPETSAHDVDDAPEAHSAADAGSDAPENAAAALGAEASGRPEEGVAPSDAGQDPVGSDGDSGPARRTMSLTASADVISEPAPADDEAAADDNVEHGGGEAEVESVGAEDALDEVRTRRRQVRRNYKIQEVIKRRQILLVQVVKEERGNKGAAMTTYLSLAGRYSVLMPNTARGGGISRKITNAQDRKRLKDVVKDLDVPQGMGVILRTAGENRTKAEIKRDYEYLMRLWENVRNLTLQSTAPALVYEEGSLIKRSVRDLYNKDIDEILVSGDEGYREAKDFMRMLMPSHAKVVQPYRDSIPIFARNGIEAQLDRMLQPQVTLKSGGYIIMNQTEALVAIDVNSGRSTKEHSIEDTALQTNLEAAEEIARQLRLRDLAGLIVIDFIDMEENRNNRAVEKKLKDCLKNDRARIQVGRISHFGLMEMSRQRIRASVLESTMKPCPQCGGTGHVRSDSSVALHVIRAIEEFLLKDSRAHITVRTPASTALYVLNQKRTNLAELEARFGLTITIEADDTVGPQHYAIVKGSPIERRPETPEPISADLGGYEPIEVEEQLTETEEEIDEADRPARAHSGEDSADRHRRRRRRKRRRGRDGEPIAEPADETAAETGDREEPAEGAAHDHGHEEAGLQAADEADQAEAGDRKKRRRGKRGGKRNRQDEATDGEPGVAAAAEIEDAEAADEADAAGASVGESKPASASAAARNRSRGAAESAVAGAAQEPPAAAGVGETEDSAPAHAAANGADAQAMEAEKASEKSEIAAEAVVSSLLDGVPAPENRQKPRKSGWWQRRGFF